VLVNGILITGRQMISSQDLIALGTTTFLIIDREQVRETIVSPLISLFKRKKLLLEPKQGLHLKNLLNLLLKLLLAIGER